MKKVVFSFFIMMAVITLAPLAAHAVTIVDDFNDTTMDPTLWVKKTIYEANPVPNLQPFTFEENGKVLDFASNDQAGAYGGYAKYTSSWTVDFNNDFYFSVKYSTPSSGLPNPGYGGLQIGMHDGGTEKFEMWASAVNDGSKKYFDAQVNDVRQTNDVERPDSGAIGISYSQGDDTLKFWGGETKESAIAYASITDFTKTYGGSDGFQNLRVYLEGDSYNADYSASFDDFKFDGVANFSVPTVTPEPVSASLFLLGGGFLAVKRFRRKT